MTDLQRDPIINVIQNGIKRDIEITLSNNCLRAAVILIYAGMDAMAFLDMPSDKSEVTRDEFIRWADRYIRFPCKEQLSGADLYGARCAMLHAYGARSRLSRSGKCRIVVHVHIDKFVPEVRYNPSGSADRVYVSILALKEAFFTGIDNFLVAVFSDKNKAKIAEERLQTFVHTLPARLNGQ